MDNKSGTSERMDNEPGTLERMNNEPGTSKSSSSSPSKKYQSYQSQSSGTGSTSDSSGQQRPTKLAEALVRFRERREEGSQLEMIRNQLYRARNN